MPWLQEMAARGLVVPICPEVAGGLPIPRPPAEIVGGDGRDVLEGQARVLREDGTDVTEAFLRGAETALSIAQRLGVKEAILKSHSPSCATRMIYDGTFSGTLKEGMGVTAALLLRNGIEVSSSEEEHKWIRKPSARKL